MLVYKQVNIKRIIVKIGILVFDSGTAPNQIPNKILFFNIHFLQLRQYVIRPDILCTFGLWLSILCRNSMRIGIHHFITMESCLSQMAVIEVRKVSPVSAQHDRPFILAQTFRQPFMLVIRQHALVIHIVLDRIVHIRRVSKTENIWLPGFRLEFDP